MLFWNAYELSVSNWINVIGKVLPTLVNVASFFKRSQLGWIIFVQADPPDIHVPERKLPQVLALLLR
jgi:hypothetical protein